MVWFTDQLDITIAVGLDIKSQANKNKRYSLENRMRDDKLNPGT